MFTSLRRWNQKNGPLAASLLLAFSLFLGCSDATRTNSSTPIVDVKATKLEAEGNVESEAERIAFIERMRPEVEAFCGDCHKTPIPGNIVRERWPGEVLQGYGFYEFSGRKDLRVPSVEDVTKFYVSQAPEVLTMPKSIVGNPLSRLNFQQTPVSKAAGQVAAARPPCVSCIKWVDLDSDGQKSLVYSDLGTGAVYAFDPQKEASVPRSLGVLYQPSHIESADLNADGRADLIVADLGEFYPADSDLGRVVWLKRQESGDEYDVIVLKDGLGRVADVRPADFDGDGDVDILVAEFGWRKTGRILMLENVGTEANGDPKFEMRVIDKRHGAMEIPLVDLNGDGHLDFVALISQEFEVVEAFINNGKGEFEIQTIWSAPDPVYGSARIELADLDGDGDLDVVYANGDSFDSGSKPYHSVQWLENQGTYPFVHHHITYMPGVLAIKVADFDNDGDVDIVAGSVMPNRLDESLEAAGIESLILLTQTSAGTFERSKLEVSQCHHGAIEVGDFDSDGTTEMAIGNFFHFQPQAVGRPDLVLWKIKADK